MSRRIEIELTSVRDETTYTWRAAGARQPKGAVAVATLPDGAGVGDRFRVEIETGLDGHEILAVIPERAPRKEANRLELMTRELGDDELVTSRLATRAKGRRGGQRERRGGGAPRRDGAKAKGAHGTTDGRRLRGGERPRSGEQGGERKHVAKKRAPRAPRLRPGHVHRNAFLDDLADEQRPVAEKLAHGGMPNLRQAIAQDNAKRREQGQPEVPAEGLIRMAESILPRLQIAEWHDRADAALAAIDDVDLRDLRSVVVAADDHAKTPETRALADELRAKLTARVERAQAEWLAELQTALDEKRVARLLNLSSRPPKAGAPLPASLADGIVEITNAALSPQSASGRWVALLDALAYSPVRARVVPVGPPAEPSDELVTKVKKLRSRLPNVAAAFGLGPSPRPAHDEPPSDAEGGDPTTR